jgi:hypothetical protein
MKRFGKWTVALGVLVAGSMPFGSAHHELTLVHQPPVIAVAGQDANLVVAIASSCAPFCSAIEVTLHYADPLGAEGTLVGTTPEFVPAGTVAFAIPGIHVTPPAVTYWFEARQLWCVFGFDCHHTQARSPEFATYSLPVSPVG